ncbi:FAD/NAD(P)-binding protein [Streptomyces sp. NPDC052676]|uniref:FAD/NAD(P)-binding protein n=1 Tax=Streptomyces sp. NPDC052676 TaxID=3154953 RepID=UPI003449F0B5
MVRRPRPAAMGQAGARGDRTEPVPEQARRQAHGGFGERTEVSVMGRTAGECGWIDADPGRPGLGAGAGRDVVIIGGGVAGTSVLVQMVDELTCPETGAAAVSHPGRVRSVRVIDPNPIGWGLAFGDDDPILLCNSAVSLNSLRVHQPEDFLHHLRQRGWTGRPEACVPRSWMAEYCHARYAQARSRAATHGIEVSHLSASASSLDIRPAGYRVRLADGREVTASDVVLCIGVHRPRVPDGFGSWQDHPRYLNSPYPSTRLRERTGRRPRRVLVLGTRQSAIDAAMMLCHDGHRVTLSSPSGLLPAVRASLAPPPHPFPPLERMARLDPSDPRLEDRITRSVVEAVRMAGPLPLRRQTSTVADPVRRLSEEIALAEAGACQWAHICVPVIEAAIALGAAVPAERRSALLAHFARLTGRYVTAMALPNARRLLAHLRCGTLHLAGRYPSDAAYSDGAWLVRWPDASTDTFDHVVNATGFHPPELFWDRAHGTLHLDRPAATDAVAVDHLEADLRVRVHATAAPERIWIVGVGTHLRIPFANHLHNVVTQAHRTTNSLLQPPL